MTTPLEAVAELTPIAAAEDGARRRCVDILRRPGVRGRLGCAAPCESFSLPFDAPVVPLLELRRRCAHLKAAGRPFATAARRRRGGARRPCRLRPGLLSATLCLTSVINLPRTPYKSSPRDPMPQPAPDDDHWLLMYVSGVPSLSQSLPCHNQWSPSARPARSGTLNEEDSARKLRLTHYLTAAGQKWSQSWKRDVPWMISFAAASCSICQLPPVEVGATNLRVQQE